MGRLALAEWRALFTRIPGALALVVALSLFSVSVHAQAHTYALVIGANRGGHGQATLQYARKDAQHFAELLVELGRTPQDRITLLLDPSPAAITQALNQLRAQLSVHAQAGEHAKLLFYYSGHARARALSLGYGEFPLDTLREQLVSLPSTLTVAVLDACQSGAISGIKGAVPAADFSVSTVSDLNNAGVAVMASSTALELSQESPELGASYFTHHLLTGLRGAADRDRDGSVSLDEAYAYAYQNTLSDTLRTRVGSQHATLEMELKGHGAVTLTYTADADAQLRLPEAIEGRVVVQQRARGAVIAELSKPLGSVLTLAVPHGDYEVLVKRGIAVAPQACLLTLARHSVHNLDTRGCPVVVPPPALAAKGGAPRFERWFAEFGLGRRVASSDDAYMTTLYDFRFVEGLSPTLAGDSGGSMTPVVAGGFGFTRHFSLLARTERLATREFERRLEGDRRPASFSYHTWSFALGVRGRLPLRAERLVPFLELDVGLAHARSKYQQKDVATVHESHFGPVLRADLGLTVHMFWRLGLVVSGGYDYAPALRNEFDEVHNDGGFHFALGLRVRGLTEAN
jgi:hypothetical protein